MTGSPSSGADGARDAGRVVVITGGSRGIGRAAARRFAARGDRVVLAARGVGALEEAESELRRQGAAVWARTLDVQSPADVADWFAWAAGTVGPPEVCVLSAGVGHWVPAAQMSDHDWQETMRVNVDGAFYCTRAALAHLLPAGRGHVVYLSSVLARRGVANMAAYAAAKAAVATLGESVAAEVKPFGVKVTVLYPGTTDTGMRDHQHDRPRTPDITEPERQLAADDVAQAIEWVTGASDRAFPTGIVLEPPGPVRGREPVSS